jgi:hypothetical protein
MLAFRTKLGNSASLREHFIEFASSQYTVNRAYTGILVYYTEYTGIISKIYRCVTALCIIFAKLYDILQLNGSCYKEC